VRIASLAQRSSVHGVWIGEDLGWSSDVFIKAGVIAMNAPSKNVGIGITSPLVRNLSAISGAAATLSELAPARFRLGLGVGGLQDLARLEIPVGNPVALLSDSVDVLRRIWAGETLTIKGENFDLWQFAARYRLGSRVPIYLGVRGPKLLRLAGRIGDGVILSGPLGYLEKAMKIVRAQTNPSRSRVTTVVWVPTMIVRTRADWKLARSVAATVIGDTPPEVLEMADISMDGVAQVQRKTKEGNYAAASKLVTRRIVNNFTISGDVRKVVQDFRLLEKLGADEIVFGPPYGSSEIRSIQEVVREWERV